jgi:hypothetical protein
LGRLRELSKIDYEEFKLSYHQKQNWRYHDINWEQPNIPIQRKDLDWVDRDYVENEEDFPLVQLTISRALGRVVGFWDENSVFNIVLLDPLHNIQPSKDFDYRVRPCFPLSCQYTLLLGEFDRIRQLECNGNACPAHAAIQRGPSEDHSYNVTIVRLSDETSKDVSTALGDGTAESLTAIIETGILTLMEKPADNPSVEN